ncbi:MAG: hypothetical protein E7463_01785 [Ruminococcaceae bacterium]|nr:hypothetical protein [Oscillospiraceae bacterium]
MKKIISLLLSILLALSLFACGSNPPATEPSAEPTVPQETETPPEPSEPKDYTRFAGIVEDPKTWYDNFMALPIANADMTEDELRQLCVDAFKANLTFQWTPTQEISYTYTLLNKDHTALLPVGKAYSGLCYATGIAKATCGTIWKILPYYDVTTGALDTAAMGGSVLNNLSSACALGAVQGWDRVSDSHGVGSMSAFNMYDANIVPVGPYTYTPEDYNRDFGSRTASNQIIAKNGAEVMYESYALMKMADGIYSSSSWHVQMIATNPVVVRDENGKIDPEQSYVYIHEQGQTGTRGDTLNYKQGNGVELRPLGTVDKKVTFKTMCDKGYIPFTLKEFIGEDPVESGKAWVGAVPEQVMENGKEISPSALTTKNLYTNYALCYIRVEVKNPAGETLCSFIPNLPTDPRNREIMLTDPQMANRLKPYANNKNTVHLYAQLSNGEYLEAFNGILKG